MHTHKTTGIVLQAMPFKEYHQLVSIFTPDLGVRKFVCNYSLSKKNALHGLFSPLYEVEIEFRKTEKDLEKMGCASLLNARLALRDSFEDLQTGLLMLKALLDSQLAHKPAPLLYNLLNSYLSLLPKAYSKEAMLASFKLKLLRHEGLLAMSPNGEIDCEGFNDEEMKHVLALGLTTSFTLLKDLSLPPLLGEKIDRLFQELI